MSKIQKLKYNRWACRIPLFHFVVVVLYQNVVSDGVVM